MATKTATPKAVNYTPEQTAQMIGMYNADKSEKTVEKIAELFGKTLRSVRAKLSRELKDGYVAKTYKTKAGEPVALKNDTADAIGKALRLGENDVSSLTKATKPALAAVWKMIVDSSNAVELAKAETRAEVMAEFNLTENEDTEDETDPE